MNPTVLVVDGHNAVWRGFYAINGYTGQKEVMTSNDGNDTSAIKGFVNIFMSDVRKSKATHSAVVFDKLGETRHHEIYPEYKANREQSETSERVSSQIPTVRLLLKAMGVKVYGKRGIEGDDISGSIAYQMAQAGNNVVISSNDKDFAALVSSKVKLLWPKADKLAGAEEVEEKFGVPPSQMVDYLALLGDKVDNVPGMPGIGGKTAVELLKKYGSIPNIYKHLSELTPKKRETFLENKEQCKISRKLITLDVNAVTVDLKKLEFQEPDFDEIRHICRELQFDQTYGQILKFLEQRGFK